MGERTLSILNGNGVAETIPLAGSYGADGFFASPMTTAGTSISLLAPGAVGAMSTTADSEDWVGGSGGAWASAADWQGDTGSFPGASTSVTIAGTSDTTYEMVSGPGTAASASVTGLVGFSGSFGLGTLLVGAETLTSAAGVVTASETAGTLLLAGGDVVSTGGLDVIEGGLLVSGGALSDSGGLSVGLPAGAIIQDGGSDDATLGASGTVDVSGGGSLAVGGASSLIQGTLAIADADAALAGLTLGASGGAGAVATAGILAVSQNATLTTSGVISELDGAITVADIGSQLTDTASLQLASTATSLAPSLSASGGGRVQVGSLLVSGGSAVLAVDAASAIEIGLLGGAALGAVTVDAGATLAADAATTIAANLIDHGDIAVGAGSTDITGTTFGLGTLTVDGGGSLTLAGAVGAASRWPSPAAPRT